MLRLDDSLKYAFNRVKEGDPAWKLDGPLLRARLYHAVDPDMLKEAEELKAAREEEQLESHAADMAEKEVTRNARLAAHASLLSCPNFESTAAHVRALRAASSSSGARGRRAPAVCSILSFSLPDQIRRLVAEKKLPAEYLNFAEGFRKAGEASAGKGMFNTAGITPRWYLEQCGMTRHHLRHLLKVFAENQLDDELINNYWCNYMWFGTESRYKNHPFENGKNRTFLNNEATFKSGDSIEGPRFRSSVTLQSPAAARYGGDIAKTMRSECYFEGYGCRLLRILSELYINWLCRDEMSAYMFYEHPASCGEEGLRGPLEQADDALRHMYDAVCRGEFLAGIFSIECVRRRGVRSRRFDVVLM